VQADRLDCEALTSECIGQRRSALAVNACKQSMLGPIPMPMNLLSLIILTKVLRAAVACLGNPDPVGMKVYAPAGQETFDDIQATKEAQAGADRRGMD